MYQVGQHQVCAHRDFLATFSGYFAAMFGSGMKESVQSEVTLHGVDGDSFTHIVDFGYCGRIAISADTVQQLLETASYLQVDQVKYGCCKYLADRLSVNNVLSVLTMADRLSLQSLVSRVNSFLLINLHFLYIVTVLGVLTSEG